MSDNLFPKNPAAKTQQQCAHEDIFFGSGGHFIFCAVCNAEWVASFNCGSDIDFERAGAKVSTADHRVTRD